jgi:acyl-CoA dehydrogenase
MSLDTIPGRFCYTPDHEAFRQTVRSFLQKEGVPHVNDWEKNRLVPKDFWRKAGEIGMLCPTVPEAYGGLGLDFGYNAIVDEEMSYNGVARKSRRRNGCRAWSRARRSPPSR